MFTYSHANTPLGQSERAYYLNYFINIYILLTKHEVKMAEYWPSSLFAFLWTELAWSIKDLLYGIKSTEKMIFVLVYFRALKRKPVICKSDNALRFSRFLVPSRQRNHRKSFYCHGKYFAKENLRAPAWTSAKYYCGNKTAIPSGLHLASSGSQSQSGIWFILLAHGACHIIIQFTRTAAEWTLTNGKRFP